MIDRFGHLSLFELRDRAARAERKVDDLEADRLRLDEALKNAKEQHDELALELNRRKLRKEMRC